MLVFTCGRRVRWEGREACKRDAASRGEGTCQLLWQRPRPQRPVPAIPRTLVSPQTIYSNSIHPRACRPHRARLLELQGIASIGVAGLLESVAPLALGCHHVRSCGARSQHCLQHQVPTVKAGCGQPACAAVCVPADTSPQHAGHAALAPLSRPTTGTAMLSGAPHSPCEGPSASLLLICAELLVRCCGVGGTGQVHGAGCVPRPLGEQAYAPPSLLQLTGAVPKDAAHCAPLHLEQLEGGVCA